MRYADDREHLSLMLNVEGWGQRDRSLQNASTIRVVATLGYWTVVKVVLQRILTIQ